MSIQNTPQSVIKQAIEYRSQIPEQEQNPFKVAQLYNNHSALLSKLEKHEEAFKASEEAVKIANKFRATGQDNQYYGKFDLRMARILISLKRFNEAKKMIESARNTFKKYESVSEQDLKSCNELEKEI